MRLVFMGTPVFVIPVLMALIDRGHHVAGVFTQPDKSSGRGRLDQPSPVKMFALEQGIPVFQPPSLRQKEAQETLAALKPEALVVAAYGKLLPSEVLALPPFGALNLHPSLLPRYRGPSPVAAAILAGDQVTGITIILLDPGMDTGPILAQREEETRPDDTAETLTRRLFAVGAELLVQTLDRWGQRELTPREQDHQRATVTKLVIKEQGEVDWHLPSELLARRVRAYQPWPGAYTYWNGKLLKLWEAIPISLAASGVVGEVVPCQEGKTPIGVITGQGVLGLCRLQIEGRRVLGAAEFLRGHRDFVGSVLPSQ